MRVPVSAIWPPILLLFADLVLMSLMWDFARFLAAPFAIGAIILVYDIAGRRTDFRNAVRHFMAGRRPERVAKTYQYSWCGRVACTAAAKAVDRDIGKAVTAWYAGSGYRWFHIFPDGAFTRNSPFMSMRFWQVTLGGNSRASARLAMEDDAAEPLAAVMAAAMRKAA